MITVLTSCKNNNLEPEINFYYWKTNYAHSEFLRNTLNDFNSKKIFLRLFDIVEDDKVIIPNKIVNFQDTPIKDIELIPVIYIKNQVFTKMKDSKEATDLANKCTKLIDEILMSKKIEYKEVQFDCDWTVSTREKYFEFLEKVKNQRPQSTISVTLRLHQIKYKEKTGIPPADHYILMYYNIGSLESLDENSIYSFRTAKKYVQSIANYPVEMTVALPIYSWEVHTRNGRVENVRIIQVKGIGEEYRKEISPMLYQIIAPVFYNGVYYKVGDIIKIEQIKINDLELIAKQLKPYSKKIKSEFILFHLDSLSLSLINHIRLKKVLAAIKH